MRIAGAMVLVPAMVLALCGCRTSPRIDGPPPRVEVRLADLEPVEGHAAMRTRQGETVFVDEETIIDLEDIFTAAFVRQGDDDRLLLNVKAGSRMRLEAATVNHVQRPIVVMIDDEVVYTPLLWTSISRQVPVRIGANGITLDEAKRIADAVADQRDFGPWSVRSGQPEASRAGRVRASRAAEAARSAPASSDEPGANASSASNAANPASDAVSPTAPAAAPAAPDRER